MQETPAPRRSFGHRDAVHLVWFTIEYDTPMSSASRNSDSFTVNGGSLRSWPPYSRIGSTSSA
ncbi:hypothetical protein [Streptomyces sp. NPDC088812]|uniref:hypothetical protein n=1 Tax=Streptomyces sp. NPDC088812 TaxID=3365905 RepID=UPI0037F8CC4F